MKIAVFNCLLSWIGMAIVSVISIFGCYLLMKQSNLGKQILLPLIFAMMLFVAVLQQSLSVHLMGYSFIFSALFSAGIIMLMISIHNRLTSPVLGCNFCNSLFGRRVCFVYKSEHAFLAYLRNEKGCNSPI